MMNDCADGDMRDRLPGYVHGTLAASERAVVAAHVATCEACTAEVELIAAAARAFPAPEVDVSRIVALLRAAPRRKTPRASALRAQRIAAAIGFVVAGATMSAIALRAYWGRAAARPAQTAARAGAAGTALVASAPPVATAPAAVVDSPARPVRAARASHAAAPTRAAMSFGGGLSDLSDEQLDMLLGELDGLDALPSVEPETHLTPILPPGDGGRGAR